MDEKSVINLKSAYISVDGNIVLSDVDFEVKSGEFVYIIGRVGSGKTSLIRALNAEFPITNAALAEIINFDLKTIKQKEIPQLRRKLGIVFQDFKLLKYISVYENLKFVLSATDWKDKTKIEQRILEVLDRVELKDKYDKKPHQLSGGEQQRVAIARALLNNPEILIADEPTGNLDPETSDKIMEILFELNSKMGITIIMATHNHGLIKKYPARTFKCEQKRIDELDISGEIDFEYFS